MMHLIKTLPRFLVSSSFIRRFGKVTFLTRENSYSWLAGWLAVGPGTETLENPNDSGRGGKGAAYTKHTSIQAYKHTSIQACIFLNTSCVPNLTLRSAGLHHASYQGIVFDMGKCTIPSIPVQVLVGFLASPSISGSHRFTPRFEVRRLTSLLLTIIVCHLRTLTCSSTSRCYTSAACA